MDFDWLLKSFCFKTGFLLADVDRSCVLLGVLCGRCFVISVFFGGGSPVFLDVFC